jgi:hypothetical protein
MVVGSIPTQDAKTLSSTDGDVGQTVNLLPSGLVGSNPTWETKGEFA